MAQKKKPALEIVIQVRFWPDGVNEELVKYVEDHDIDPANVEILSETEIIIHNPIN